MKNFTSFSLNYIETKPKRWYTREYYKMSTENKRLMQKHWDIIDEISGESRFLNNDYTRELLEDAEYQILETKKVLKKNQMG